MGRCCDFKRVKTLSGFISVIAILLHIFHIGCEIGDIVNDSFMTHTYRLESDDRLPKQFNKYVYGVTLTTVIIGSILAVPKIFLSAMQIHKYVFKKDETAFETKFTIYLELVGIVLESLPQAIMAQFFIFMCPTEPFKFQWYWLFKVFVSCTIEPPLKSCFTFILYLTKKHIRKVTIYVIVSVTGIVLGLTTVGFAIPALMRDIETTCLFSINSNSTILIITNRTTQS